MHKLFSSPEEIEMVHRDCQTAALGCVDCKKLLARNLNRHLEPFRARRADLEAKPEYVQGVLEDGASRARKIAEKTMAEVREAIQLP
jgi:tryptophanyl-tRNA synthetase